MSKHLLATIAGSLAIVALLTGCGGGGSGSLSKAELIERGDELCADASANLGARIHNYGHQLGFAHKRTGPTPKQENGLITDVILPRFQAVAEELGELSPPEDEAAEFEEIVAGLEEAVAESETSPNVLRSVGNPFEEVKEKATAFGFEVCGES